MFTRRDSEGGWIVLREHYCSLAEDCCLAAVIRRELERNGKVAPAIPLFKHNLRFAVGFVTGSPASG